MKTSLSRLETRPTISTRACNAGRALTGLWVRLTTYTVVFLAEGHGLTTFILPQYCLCYRQERRQHYWVRSYWWLQQPDSDREWRSLERVEFQGKAELRGRNEWKKELFLLKKNTPEIDFNTGGHPPETHEPYIGHVSKCSEEQIILTIFTEFRRRLLWKQPLENRGSGYFYSTPYTSMHQLRNCPRRYPCKRGHDSAPERYNAHNCHRIKAVCKTQKTSYLLDEIRERSTDARIRVAQKTVDKGDPSNALSKPGSLVFLYRLALDNHRGRKLEPRYEGQ